MISCYFYYYYSPLLKKLHWLPVKSRINFKIATLIYKCIYFKQPISLASQIKICHLNKSLRSQSNAPFLARPFSKSYGYRSFSKFAPVVWNNLLSTFRLSPSLSIFRRKLKTYYFSNIPIT